MIISPVNTCETGRECPSCKSTNDVNSGYLCIGAGCPYAFGGCAPWDTHADSAVHNDHPLRHYDRTCPVCNAGVAPSQTQPVKPAPLTGEQVDAILYDHFRESAPPPEGHPVERLNWYRGLIRRAAASGVKVSDSEVKT